jgi:hypothetical protein
MINLFEHGVLQPIIVKNGTVSFYESFRLAEKMRKRKVHLTLMISQILKKINDGFGQI